MFLEPIFYSDTKLFDRFIFKNKRFIFYFCFFLKKKERIHLIIDSAIIAVADRGKTEGIIFYTERGC